MNRLTTPRRLFSTLPVSSKTGEWRSAKSAFISPTSRIGSGSEVGSESNLWYFASVDANTKIGEMTNVMEFATIGRNTKVGGECFIGARSIVGNDVVIGNNVEIG